MANKQEILKNNLFFLYGRNSQEISHDLDKRIYKRSISSSSNHLNNSNNSNNNINIINNFNNNNYNFLLPSYNCFITLNDDNIIYKSYEHALQATKTNNINIRNNINNYNNIKELKNYIKNEIIITNEWKNNNLKIAERLLREKFYCNKELKLKLLETGHIPIYYVNEFNDLYWGMNSEYKGQNHYGKLIEIIRDDIEKNVIEKKWIADKFDLEVPEDIQLIIKSNNNNNNNNQTISNYSVIHIGKLKNNEFIVQHPTVSSNHCLLIADKQKGLLLIDLNSTNGTFLNGNITERISSMIPHPITSEITTIQFGACSTIFTIEYKTNQIEFRKQQLLIDITDESKTNSLEDHDDTTVFISNINKTFTETEIRNYFNGCGRILDIKILKSNNIIVVFETMAGAYEALCRDGDLFDGEILKIKRSIKKEKRKSINEKSERNREYHRDNNNHRHERNERNKDNRDIDRNRDRENRRDRSRDRSRERNEKRSRRNHDRDYKDRSRSRDRDRY